MALAGEPVGAGAAWRRVVSIDAMIWPTLAIAAVLCLVTFVAGGGLSPESMTSVEIALTIGGGVLVALAIVLAPARAGRYGLGTAGLLLAFTVLTALSVVWSVAPDDSWQQAGRMLAYSAFFGGSLAVVRLAPDRWPAVLGGVTLSAAVICGYAVLTKIYPAQLDPNDIYARLQEPYGYWNAIGLTAAMGAIGAMWLGARRAGHALLSALAYPAMGLFIVTLMLAYSRGALVALAIGVVLWFCVMPLRLRGAAVLMIGGAGAAAVLAWDFSKHALSAENVALPERVTAGHQLGAAMAAMLLVLALAGVAIGFRTARKASSIAARRKLGAVLLGVIVLAIAGFCGMLAHSHRGLFGSVSHALNSVTNPNAPVPANTPGRLTAIGSVRARYWKEALEVFQANPVLGAGAEGYATASLRYRTALLEARHAHGFVVQTLADLGLVGLAVTLALLIAWLTAAGRATHPFGRRWRRWRWRSEPLPYSAERVGMLSMLCIAVVFGAHSLMDWTWYVPGNACVALLCAGWLAGRGPLGARRVDPFEQETIARWPSMPTAGWRVRLPSLQEIGPVRATLAGVVLLAVVLAVWSQWEPQSSMNSSNEALTLVEQGQTAAALSTAQSAVSSDPLSAEALFTLSTVQQDAGQSATARATLARAVHLQPSNPKTWQTLGEYDLQGGDIQSARDELRAAVFLDPQSVEAQNAFVLALRKPLPATAAKLPSEAARVKPSKPTSRH